MKIFVIGFNKTGTSSIHKLFEKLNIKSVHDGNKPVLDMINDYDAFTDGTHFFFEKYYEKYPDALFILNTRPIFNWLVSRYKHASCHNFEKCWCWPISNKLTNEWINSREEHYKKIIKFFSNKKNQLLIINIEKDGYEDAICKFIGKQCHNIKSKVNVKKDEKIIQIEEIKKNVREYLTKLNYTGEELLFNKNINVDINKFNTFL